MPPGISLVLCPGLLCDDALWTHQTAALSDIADVRVADFKPLESIRGMAESVLMAAPSRFALAGFSMGGYVAQEIMRLAPDRVDRLALLDTLARADSPEQTQRRKAMMDQATRGRFRGVTAQLMPLLLHESRLADTALTEAISAMAERVGQAAFMRHQVAIAERVDGRTDLPAISCPTLVLCGRNDQLTPSDHHHDMAAAIAGADLVVLGDCGHMSPMERPDAVSTALRGWLMG